MAKVLEEVVVIKLSKLVKDNVDPEDILLNQELMTNVEVLVQELVGEGVVVEVMSA